MRIKEFQGFLKEKKIDAALLFSRGNVSYEPNLFYLTNYSGAGCLIVPKSDNPVLAVPEMELQRAKNSLGRSGQIKKVHSLNKAGLLAGVSLILKRNGLKIKRMGLDNNSVSVNAFKSIKHSFKKREFVDVSEELAKLRAIKTPAEAEFLKKSCSYADKIIQKFFQNVKTFKTETDVSSFLEHHAKKLGLELSFPVIVASGVNSGIPHYTPKSTGLKGGFCVVDFGVRFNGYCSDMTRTIYIGSPSKEEREMYKLVLGVQISSINCIEENKNCSEIYDYSLKMLGKYKKYFTHGLGHGVGVEIHELPNLTLNSLDRIRNGMVFTVEPGIYLPKKFGIRIEDTLLFHGKAQILTKTSKDLIIF